MCKQCLTFNLSTARDLELTKRLEWQDMCELVSGDAKQIEASISDDNNYRSALIIHYWLNAKCEPTNKNIKLKGNRPFKCRPVTYTIMEKIPGLSWTPKKITVACKFVIKR